MKTGDFCFQIQCFASALSYLIRPIQVRRRSKVVPEHEWDAFHAREMRAERGSIVVVIHFVGSISIAVPVICG